MPCSTSSASRCATSSSGRTLITLSPLRRTTSRIRIPAGSPTGAYAPGESVRLPQQERADGEAVQGELGPDDGQVSRVVLRNRVTGTRRQLKHDSQWKSTRVLYSACTTASGSGYT